MMKEAGSREARREDDGGVILRLRADWTKLLSAPYSLLAERHTRKRTKILGLLCGTSDPYCANSFFESEEQRVCVAFDGTFEKAYSA
jgi:hypothetical protein